MVKLLAQHAESIGQIQHDLKIFLAARLGKAPEDCTDDAFFIAWQNVLLETCMGMLGVPRTVIGNRHG